MNEENLTNVMGTHIAILTVLEETKQLLRSMGTIPDTSSEWWCYCRDFRRNKDFMTTVWQTMGLAVALQVFPI